MDDILQLARQAEVAVNAGRWDEAERLWREVRRRDPKNAKAAFSLGVHAMQRRDFAGAVGLIEEARRLSPRDPFLLLTLSKARREVGDAAGEGEALEAALAIDPYFLPALLGKAQRLERLGARQAAAMFYRSAVRVAPPEPQWPDVLRAQLAHARGYYSSYGEALLERLEAAIAPALPVLDAGAAGRWREAASIMAGRTKPYLQDANQLAVPRLPAIPFYDRSMFPWAAALEAKTDVIREELKAALAKEGKDFTPYIALRPGDPVNQWKELNHSTRWSHYSLWRGGAADEAHLAACPETAKALGEVDMATIAGLCPERDVLGAGAAYGDPAAPWRDQCAAGGAPAADRAAEVHLSRRLRASRMEGRARSWCSTTRIEHTARNDSDELRVVLIFDVWNPLIPVAERPIVSAMAEAARGFGG